MRPAGSENFRASGRCGGSSRGGWWAVCTWEAKMSGVRNAELERKSELSEGGRGSRALRTEFRRAMGEFSGLASREFKGRGRRRWSSMGMESDG